MTRSALLSKRKRDAWLASRAETPSGSRVPETLSGSRVPETPSGSRVPETQISTDGSTSRLPLTQQQPEQQNTEESDHDSDTNDTPRVDRRPFIVLVGKDAMRPAPDVSTKIGEIVTGKLLVGKHTWGKIPTDHKYQLWAEFKNHYRYEEKLEYEVKRRFFKKGGQAYKNKISRWKTAWLKGMDRPIDCGEEAWNSFITYWQDPKVEKNAEQAKKNRLKEVEPGEGPSKSFGGRCSYEERAQRMSEKLGKEVTPFEVYCDTRQNKNGEWVDKRSKRIAETYEQRVQELEEDATQEQKDAIFFEVNPKDKKQRMWGMGSLAKSLGSTGQPRSQGLFTQEDVNVAVHVAVKSVEEKMQQKMDEQKDDMDKQKEEIHQQLQQQKEEQNQSLASLTAKIELLMSARQPSS